MGSIGGQSNGGEYSLNQGALRILYSLIKDTIPALAADGFTQSNPPVVDTTAAVSTTLGNKLGVLGGSVAFTRVDVGSNTVGGPVLVDSEYVNLRPMGLFINDALGNAFENTPAVASGKAPYIRGGSVGLKIYETQQQTTTGGGSVGADLPYNVGDKLYASVNGLLTNRWQDSYEAQYIDQEGGAGTAIEPDVTCMGVVLSAGSTTSTEMFLSLRFV
jgi:hypothetical protein